MGAPKWQGHHPAPHNDTYIHRRTSGRLGGPSVLSTGEASWASCGPRVDHRASLVTAAGISPGEPRARYPQGGTRDEGVATAAEAARVSNEAGGGSVAPPGPGGLGPPVSAVHVVARRRRTLGARAGVGRGVQSLAWVPRVRGVGPAAGHGLVVVSTSGVSVGRVCHGGT